MLIASWQHDTSKPKILLRLFWHLDMTWYHTDYVSFFVLICRRKIKIHTSFSILLSFQFAVSVLNIRPWCSYMYMYMLKSVYRHNFCLLTVSLLYQRRSGSPLSCINLFLPLQRIDKQKSLFHQQAERPGYTSIRSLTITDHSHFCTCTSSTFYSLMLQVAQWIFQNHQNANVLAFRKREYFNSLFPENSLSPCWIGVPYQL